jgi:hypothetical protein
MTAPASCPSQFVVTTSATVDIPSLVTNQITPTSTINGGLSTAGRYYTYSLETWYLSAGAAPFTSTDDYYYRYYVRDCSTPPSYGRSSSTSSYYYGGGGSSGGTSRDDDDSSSRYCYRYSYYSCTSLRTWVIIVATVLPGLFLLGFLESWFWFRRLMTGKSALRCGTVSWILLSLFVLCFTRMQDARSKDDQKLLKERWNQMGSGAAFKAWLKYGLRRKYPEEHLGQYSKLTVGVVSAGQPLHPAMAQAPGFMPPPPPGAPGQVYYYGPPPPGWIPTPDGHGFMPPQGHMSGYYAGDLSKNAPTVSASPISQHPAMAQQPPVSPIEPPQAVHHASPPPQGPLPAAPIAPQAANLSEAPTQTTANPPQTTANPPTNAPTHTAHAPQIPPLKNDPNDRSLYE